MAKIVLKSDGGTKAIIKTSPKVKFIVGGAFRGRKGLQGDQGNGVPLGGDQDDILAKASNGDNDTIWKKPTADTVIHKIIQPMHGLQVGKIVFFNGTYYQRSRADTIANAEVAGMVSKVIDADTFLLCVEGFVDGLLASFTPGPIYWLSPTDAGDLTIVKPTTDGQVAKALFTPTTANSGLFHNYIGYEV